MYQELGVRLGPAVLAVILAVALVACRESGPAVEPAVRVAVWHAPGDAATVPLVVATRADLFAGAGLRIERVVLGQDVANTAADVHFMARGRFHWESSADPDELSAFAFAVQEPGHSAEALIIKADVAVFTVAGVRKQPLVPVVGAGSGAAAMVTQALRAMGLPERHFRVTVMGPQELERSAFIVAFVREPTLSTWLARGTVRVLSDGPVSESVLSPWPTGVAAFSRSFVTTDPARARRFVEAYDRALTLVEQEPERARALVAEHLRETEGLPNAIRFMRYLRSDEVSVELLARQAEWFHKQGMSQGTRYAARSLYRR